MKFPQPGRNQPEIENGLENLKYSWQKNKSQLQKHN